MDSMDSNVVKFLLKVMVASALISLGIKYIGPLLPIPPVSAIALGAVLLPPLCLGGFLTWRIKKSQLLQNELLPLSPTNNQERSL
ncbi:MULTISPECIES: hypothetical protein [Planktothricoides]|uniref:Uncharacterized protein n=2 Tax=Planktothricoides raciborskii TaxID=132608 RepID=A0AAU8J8I5_9CYAN|nr:MULTISPECIES: hypothetical protein [Planktothricoides]KOR36500.1 hypothetical protein AM228_12075 [Planktothricoides sp. SR001]MBD2582939.1 hypothetical protein [Planktothricoides raciborskii FACHB-1261]